jgi:ABC-type branched-subunit amino acid transport system ATPase component
MREFEIVRASSAPPMLEVRGLRKRFKGNQVLRGVTGCVNRGSATALIGSNGAGKSTFLNVISGLLSSDEGTILLNGRDITRRAGFSRARAGIGRTFQHPRAFTSLTVREAVLMARTPPGDEGIGSNLARALGVPRKPPELDRQRVQECLEICRLEHLSDVTADRLSYGERKLLMFAQVLAFDRDLICLDELCAGLEANVVEYLMGVFSELVRNGKTILFVEHNLELVRELADEIVFLHEGTVYRSGPAGGVLADPEVISLYLGE